MQIGLGTLVAPARIHNHSGSAPGRGCFQPPLYRPRSTLQPASGKPSMESYSSTPAETSTQTRYRPYPSSDHKVSRGRYITSNDARGFIPVYEYPLGGQWIMMDSDDGYVLWTGIWKALGNSKADIVRMLEARPDWAPQVRRVRGGYLKIQGTWLPYETALMLSCRVAWPIRRDLIPLFGPDFPDKCLAPGQPGYGQVLPSLSVRRKRRPAAPPGENAPTHAPVSVNGPSPTHSPTLGRTNEVKSNYPPALMGPPAGMSSAAQALPPARVSSVSPRFTPYPSSALHSAPARARSPPRAVPITLPPLQFRPDPGPSGAVRLPSMVALGENVPGTHEAWYCPEDARDVLRRLREPEDQQSRPLERNQRLEQSPHPSSLHQASSYSLPSMRAPNEPAWPSLSHFAAQGAPSRPPSMSSFDRSHGDWDAASAGPSDAYRSMR